MFVGDICLGEYYPSFGHGPGTFSDSRYVFSKVQHIFDLADFVVGNLEAPITQRNVHLNEAESSVLKVTPKHSKQLQKAGFGVLQIANNHIVQHSSEGFDDTLRELDSLQVKPVGLNNESPVLMECNGLKVGFLAASDVPDNTNKQQDKYQRLDKNFIEKIKAEVKNYDHLIVLLHWGLEASTKPLPYQRQLANELREAGVTAIVGNHPHLFYEIEKSGNFVSAYSLGNFVFDLCWDSRMLKSGILDIELTKQSVNVKLWPVELKENGCLPTPTGEAITIENKLTLYNLGNEMGLQQLKKTAYLILNLHKGNTLLKIKFFTKKITSLFGNRGQHDTH